MPEDATTERETVLVTGATGFTGGHLARRLVERGARVRALVRPGSDGTGLSAAGIEIVEGDLVDPTSVERAVAGCDRVYHIAALFRTAGHPDRRYVEVNVEGTRNVLTAARGHGVRRTVHCSTVGVHGHIREVPADEFAPYAPCDIYQRTKMEGEQLALAAIESGQPVSIFRPTGIFGPGDLRFLKLFRTIAAGRFRMFGSGEIPYHFTYVSDLVEGIVLCGEHPAAVGQTFILAGERYASLNEIVGLVSEAVGRRAPRGHLPLAPLLVAATLCEWVCVPFGIDPPLHRRRCDFFTKARAFDDEKARRMLGYRPVVSLEEGIRRTARWYADQGLLPAATR